MKLYMNWWRSKLKKVEMLLFWRWSHFCTLESKLTGFPACPNYLDISVRDHIECWTEAVICLYFEFIIRKKTNESKEGKNGEFVDTTCQSIRQRRIFSILQCKRTIVWYYRPPPLNARWLTKEREKSFSHIFSGVRLLSWNKGH